MHTIKSKFWVADHVFPNQYTLKNTSHLSFLIKYIIQVVKFSQIYHMNAEYKIHGFQIGVKNFLSSDIISVKIAYCKITCVK